ncbi:MAG: autotransporter-associated beta strand repeat-containing protein [Verrucomicrobia bacterium]|nr:autotransporter-associated beta strand repeat-containing protein [Verrucomicrobiota bacterium]
MKTNPTNRFHSARRLLTVICVGCALSIQAHAAPYTWDADGIGPMLEDGGGNWNPTGGTNWSNGVNNGAWGNTTVDEAIFGVANGAADTITVGTVTANKLTFNAPGSGSYTLSGGAITLGGTTPTITANVNATIDSALAGSAFTKTGTATLTLNGSVAGAITANSGTLALGGTATRTFGTLASGANLQVSGTSIAVFPGGGIKGALTINTGGTARNSAAHMFDTATARVHVNGGTLTSGTGFSYPEYYLPPGASAADPGVQMTGGTITGGEKRWSTGSSYVRINAAATTATFTSYVNQYAVGGSTVNFETVGGTVPNGVDFLCTGDMGNAGWGGTVNYVKTGAGLMEMTGRPILGGNGTFTVTNGTLRLTGANAVTNFGTTSSTLALDAANSVVVQLNAAAAGDSLSFTKKITGGSASATVSKIGPGTVTLSPAASSTFAGTLAVNNGRLYLNAPFTTAPAVSVASAATFGGSSTAGTVTVANNGSLEGGSAGSGTLTAGTVTLGAGASDTATLKGTIGGAAPLSVTNLSINGGDGTVLLDASGSGLVNGTAYDLLVSANPITAPNATTVLATLKANSRSLTPQLDGTGTKIQLLYGTPDSIYWTGANGAAWNTTDTNWKLTTSGSGTQFMANDTVFFHDSPVSDTVDISGANVSPASVTFDNTATTTYTVTGTNGIAGAATLSVTGGGKVILANPNTYTGATTVNNGTLQLGDAITNGSLSASSALTVNGTLAIANSNGDQSQGTHFTGSAIVGTCSLYKTGTSKLTLTAANGFSGTTVSQGSLQLNNASGAGAAVTLGDANTADTNVALICPTSTSIPITVSADNTGTGTVTLSQPTQYMTFAGTIAANRPLVISAGGDRVGVSGVISGSPGTLTFSGTRTTLDNAAGSPNTFSGTAIINSGATMQLNTSSAGASANADYTISGNFWSALGTGANIVIGAITGSGTIQEHGGVAGGIQTLNVGNTNKDGSFTGTFQNGNGNTTFGLTKSGTGTQELAGPNIKYTGATTLHNGTLILTDTTNFASSGVALSNTNAVVLGINLTNGDRTFANITGGASADARIEKTGERTATLTGGNFAGSAADALKVTEGTLFVDGPFTANATVAGALGGSGTVGHVLLSNAAVIEGGHSGSGFLTTGDLTIGSASTDTVTVRGTLAAGHTPVHAQALTLNGGNGSVLLSATGAGLVNGQYYDVISYSSISAPNALSPQDVFTSTSRAYAPYVNTGANKVQLYYDANASLYWTGIGSAEWSTAPSLNNWKLNGTNGVTDFQANDVVVFGNQATNTTVYLDVEDVSPLGTTIDNDAAHPYTIEGYYGIATGSLTKLGAGEAVVSSYNTYTGGSTLTAGTLEAGSAEALGTSGSIAMNGGTLRFSAANATDYSARLRLEDGKTATFDTNGRTVTFANVLTTGAGTTGSLRKTGAGTLTLGTTAATNNTYTGGTTISAGTLRLDGGSNGYCAGTGTITLGDADTPAEGASLGVYGAGWTTGPDRWVSNAITVSATGPDAGPLVISRPTGAYAATIKGDITLANDVTFRNTTGDRLAIEGKITGTGNVTIEGNRVNFDKSTNDYVGSTTIASGGILQLNNNNVIPATSDATVNGQLSFQSDAATALAIASLAGTGTVNIPWGSGNPVLTVGADGSSHDATFSGAIQSRIALTKTGDCAQTLSGTGNTYTGATVVEEGRLLIDGSKTGSGTVTVKSGATLGGSGSVSGTTTLESGATLAPGNSVGTLTFTGAVDLQAGSAYAVEITAAATNDRIVTGGLTANGTISVSLGTFVPANGEIFDVADGAISGTPAFVFADSNSSDWDTSSFATDGTIKYIGGVAGYQAWANANAPGQTMAQDHDNDGVDNGIEYFMGLSGNGFTQMPAPDAGKVVTWTKGAGYAGVYGTDYWIEISPDLGTTPWTKVNQADVTFGTGTVSYDLDKAPADPVKFARLVVTGP